MSEKKKLVEIRHLKKYFKVNDASYKGLRKKKNTLRAVDDVSFDIYEGETFGLVGESGCGKTTLGKSLIFLPPPTSGKVWLEGRDLSTLSKAELREARTKMQIVFQDPYSSLNARMSIGTMLQEPMLAHGIGTKQEIAERTTELLHMVGLKSFHAHRYPHEFSGGQRQRIAIARALALNPSFIVCDEPVSALDVSVQSQVLNLLTELRNRLSLTYLFISHDLSVVRHISDRIGVMYLGKIVELATEDELYRHQLHPYTRALFSAMPTPRVGVKKERIILQGDLPSPANPPSGCAFHGRCPFARKECSEQTPVLKEVAPGHQCACHIVQEV